MAVLRSDGNRPVTRRGARSSRALWTSPARSSISCSPVALLAGCGGSSGGGGAGVTAQAKVTISSDRHQLDCPGIIFRGPAHDRRAALAAGPDVWEVIARLQELDDSEEQRISLLSAESDLHPRLIRIALDYAAEHSAETRERIERNQAATERSRGMSQQRQALLA